MALKGNRSAEKHGAGSGEKALTTGKEFTGLAAGCLQEVKNEYREGGVVAMLEERALRLTTVSDLYFKLILGSLQDEDIKKLDSYVARYGWLQNSSIRALLALREAQKNQQPEALDLSEYRENDA